MKALAAAGLLLGQIGAAQPLAAATIDDQAAGVRHKMDAFAGARLRLPLDGSSSRLSAGVAIAPIGRSMDADGAVRLRFGEGIGLTSVAGAAPRFSVAGQSVRQIRAAWQNDDAGGGNGGVPTWALVAGGVLVAVVVAGALYVDAGNDATE